MAGLRRLVQPLDGRFARRLAGSLCPSAGRRQPGEKNCARRPNSISLMPKRAVQAPAGVLDVDSPSMVAEESLLFDAQNPRFYGQDGASDQQSMLLTLWRDFAVDEIALSIAANGYFAYEPLFAAVEEGANIVVEGNRRLAAVKLLRHQELRQMVGATELPKLSAKEIKALGQLPAIVTSRERIWQYIGFKHVNGPQPWQSSSKAQYIAWVHNSLEISLEDIARRIGDQHATVKRLYRGLMVLQQAEEVFDPEDRAKSHFSFSHLYTGLDYPGIRKFLGLTEARDFTPRPITRSKIRALGELCVWLYGSKSSKILPLVQSQNPDLRKLDEVLQSPNGTAALRQGLPLNVSLDISRGDERLFREALVGTKSTLQDARGKLLTGYSGEPDLLQTAEQIAELADSMVGEMQRIRRERRRQSSRPAGRRR
jgi:hypothetical protein